MSSSQQEPPLKRETERAELSKVPSPVIDQIVKDTDHSKAQELHENQGLLNRIKEGLTDITSKISGEVSHLKEKILHHGHQDQSAQLQKENENKENQEENESLGKKIKEKAQAIKKSISDVVGEYPDPGDLSSETTIQPNREGPSTLDKINEDYAKIEEKITEKIEGIKEKILPSENNQIEAQHSEKPFTQKFQEGVASLARRISETFEEVPGKVKGVMEEISDDMTLRYDEDKEISKESREESRLESTELAPTKNVSRVELKEFKEVKSGFSGTVNELKEEKSGEIGQQGAIKSNNPFEVLSG